MQSKAILIACDVVAKELRSRIGDSTPIRVIDPALHVHPERLKKTLQQAINQEEAQYGTIALGYGLCSRAVEGLSSARSRIVIPKVDDCIGLFLGSRSAHLSQLKAAPGSFFLSRGWVEAGSTPFEEYKYMVKRFGQRRADQLIKTLLHNYTNLTYIDTTCGNGSTPYRNYAKSQALQFGLSYNEITGTPSLFDQLVNGLDSKQLQIIRPGEKITYEMFVG